MREMRPPQTIVAVVLASMLLASLANAYELIMFRRAGCPWCSAWDREIGPIYPRTDVGRKVPLRLLDLDRDGMAGFELRSPIRFTPTFVVVDDRREVGRIEGYPGEDFFWGRLESLVAGGLE
jgi:thioredoxin-related protein